MLSTLIIWLVVGVIGGFLASLVMNTNKTQNIFGDMIIGVVGAFIAGTLYTLLTQGTLNLNSGISGFNVGSIALATIGAIILTAIIRFFRANRGAL